MTTSDPSSPGSPRTKWFLLGLAAALLLVAVVAVVLIARGDSSEYDEDAHRRVIEAYGVTVTDWDEYRAATFDACEFDEDTFELYVLMDDDLGRLQLDIEYACPDRMDEFTDITGMQPLD